MKLDSLAQLNVRGLNPLCPVSNAAKWCAGDCDDAQIECIIACSHDTACVSECNRSYSDCQVRCPCYDECYDGCPCEYDTKYCSEPAPGDDEISMLIISSRKETTSNDQIKFKWPINLDGSMDQEVTETFAMEIPDSFENRKGTCHFELKGEMFIIGGDDEKKRGNRQYKVQGNKLVQIADTPFPFREGRCLNYDGEHVLLIAGWGNEKETRIFDGQDYTFIPTRTTYDHFAGGLAKYTYNGEISVVVTAGEFEYYGTTEVYSPSKKEWTYKNLTEGHQWLYGFTMATFGNDVYAFGGKIYWQDFSPFVWKMNEKFGYEKIPEQMRSLERHDFSSFQQSNRIVHFGGWDTQFAECWTLNPDGSWAIAESNETWYNWTKYPMIFGI